MSAQDDGLFLLEVLIDKVVFAKSPCLSDRDFRTCVTVKCLSVDPLEICDDEASACVAKSGGPFVKTFNSGKSCLFSLKESEISSAMSKFLVKVTVSKSLPCGCLPAKIVMGEANIDMTKEFVEARKRFLEDPTVVTYQALKDSFHIVKDSVDAGEIVMFLRISCFGKLIITRFQGSTGPPHLGAGGPSVIDRSCNPTKEYQSQQDPCACGAAHASGSAPQGTGPPCATYGSKSAFGGPCPVAVNPYNNAPCEDPDDPCYCTGPKQPQKQAMSCRNTAQYCLHLPKGRSKQYEEVGMNLSGNELKIKVPANASVIKKISQTHCALQTPFTKGKGAGLCVPPCGKNQISLQLPSEDICCLGAPLANTQFTCTTEGCPQTSKHGQQSSRGDDKIGDPLNKDVFVFKVAKTALQGDRKCKLELELVTPKGGDKKLPVQTENRRLQADNCQCCNTCHIKRGKRRR